MTINNPKTIRAWCFYDWANSVYTLTITTVVFPIFFSSVTRNEATADMISFFGFGIKNTVLYTYSLSVAFLVIAFINPLLSGIADYSGRKKAFMKFFTLLGATACSSLFFFDGSNIEFGIIAFMLGAIGYAGSLVFYNAFLPEIVTPDRMDSVSARGYSYGYIGSVILLIINLIVILSPATFGITNDKLPSQIAFLTVGIWWLVFSIIPFRNLPPDKPGNVFKTQILWKGYKEARQVFSIIKKHALMKWFLPAFFFYSMGFQTMMYLASIFAESELKLPLAGLITVMLIIQLIAIPGAYLFSYGSSRFGNIEVLIAAVIVCMFVCLGAYYVNAANQFYAIAVVVGIIMGGIQSLSRSTFSKLIPPTEEHASFFSFYELSEKVAIVLGTASYGILLQITGTMRNSALGLMVFFAVGLILLLLLSNKKERAA